MVSTRAPLPSARFELEATLRCEMSWGAELVHVQRKLGQDECEGAEGAARREAAAAALRAEQRAAGFG